MGETGDYRKLYRRGGGRWYVQISIPVALRQRLGRKLIQTSLGTSDINAARDMRWPYIHGWQKAFDAATADPNMTRKRIENLAAREIERQQALEAGG